MFFTNPQNCSTLPKPEVGTSDPIGAWKCNFSIFKEIMTERQTNRPTNRLVGKLQFQYYGPVCFNILPRIPVIFRKSVKHLVLFLFNNFLTYFFATITTIIRGGYRDVQVGALPHLFLQILFGKLQF